MGDGAHLGIMAGRALATILGGKSQPTDEERLSQKEFVVWIRSAPHELEDIKSGKDGCDGYTEASRWLAKRYLAILEQAPAVTPNIAWQVFRTRWPDDVEKAGGMTGFMHGWAWNAARNSLGYNPVPNPAIVTMGIRQPSIFQKLGRWAAHLWNNRYNWLKINFL